MEWKFDGNRIQMAREARGITQAAFATMIGVAQSQLSQWEAGSIVPGQKALEKIINASGTPPEFFYVRRAKDGNDGNGDSDQQD